LINRPLKIALVVSHPIQHFCPQYVSFAENKQIEFKVFFASTLGFKKYTDPSFKKEISWNNLNLDQFQHEFLNGEKVIKVDKNIDAISLNTALDQFSPQLVIGYGYFQRLQRRAKKWANKNKIPLAYISDSELRQPRNKLKELIKCPFLYHYFSSVAFFLSVGDSNEMYYRKYGVKNAKILRMHFPIDLKSYRKAYDNRGALNDQIRKQYKIKKNEFVISVVGKMVASKNHDHIIEALIEVEKKNEGVHLFVVGSGEMEEVLKEKANKLTKSNVHFTGFISPDELPSYYAATDLYIHPSLEDRHPLAVSEAIYMGCPVIISDTCGSYGPGDDVQDGRNGYVYSFGNTVELAERILLLIRNKEARKKQGECSHKIAVDFQDKSHYRILDELAKRINN